MESQLALKLGLLQKVNDMQSQEELRQLYEQQHSNDAAIKCRRKIEAQFASLIGSGHKSTEVDCMINETTGKKFYYVKKVVKNNGNF